MRRSAGTLAMTVETASLAKVAAARAAIAETALRTPLVLLNVWDAPADIYLKLENLQPIGAFKLRGAANFFASYSEEELAEGVWTASSGNMAQAVAYMARKRGVPATIVMPDTAPATKVEAVRRLGGRPVFTTYEGWERATEERAHPGVTGLFVHPFDDEHVIEGNGTIALEILEQLGDVDAIIAPWGGGGLASGIGAAIKAAGAKTRVLAAEFDGRAPLAAAFAAGSPQILDVAKPAFLDAMADRYVQDSMWERAQKVIDGALLISAQQIAAAIRLLAERNRVIAEAAGAAPLAVALTGQAGDGRIVCVVSGGNIETEALRAILAGQVPNSGAQKRIQG